MKNKIILPIFAVLFFLGVVPFSFTAEGNWVLFGWLPAPMAFWWTLMFVNLIFVLCVGRHFVKMSRKGYDKE